MIVRGLLSGTEIKGTDRKGRVSCAGRWMVKRTWFDGSPICLL